MNPSVLSLDVGQSGTRARLGAESAECSGVVTDHPVVPQLASIIRDAIGQLATPEIVAIGSSGLKNPHGQVRGLAAELAGSGVKRMFLAHDSVTNYLAAVGDALGVVVAAGTGVVTLAVGRDEVARVDGWGYLIGDAGSGYWIGRAGLDAVMRAYDGRGRATALTSVVAEEFDDFAQIYLELQGSDAKVSRIARYAKHVAELAPSDDVCHQICERAATELASSALAGLAQVGLTDDEGFVVGLSGQIFGSSVIRRRVEQLVAERYPHAQLTESHASSLEGVAWLAHLERSHPLATRIGCAAVR